MTSLGETYEKLMKFIRFFVNRAPASLSVIAKHLIHLQHTAL